MQNFTWKSVAIVDDGSFIGLLLAKYAKAVQIVKPNDHFLGVILAYIEENRIQNIHVYDDIAPVPFHGVNFATDFSICYMQVLVMAFNENLKFCG